MDFLQVLETFTSGQLKSECFEIILPLALIMFLCRGKWRSLGHKVVTLQDVLTDGIHRTLGGSYQKILI